MQIFDALSLLLCVALIGLLISSRTNSQWLKGSSIALAICVAAHLIFEGVRWQMVPAYLVIITGFICVAGRLKQAERSKAKSRLGQITNWLGVAGAGILVVATLLLSYAFPIFDVPEPDGTYLVGTTELHLVDQDRSENYTANATDNRELMVRVWYPAETTSGYERANYWDQSSERSTAVTHATPLPWFTFTHLGVVPTNSFWNAPVAKADKPYPVLLYSHGIGIGWASSNTVIVEGLASRGYVVVGINHAYIGSISIFPDGRIARFDQATANTMNQPPSAEVRELQTQMLASKDWREQVALYAHGMTLMSHALTHVDTALSTQVADQQFVLAELANPQNDQFASIAASLDLTRAGILGMSLGGSAALETCSVSSSCKAGVNLDGFHPRHIELGLESTPFLFINREDNLLFNSNFHASRAPVYSSLISGVTHFNFFDFAIMSPLYKRLGVLGPTDGLRGLKMIEEQVSAFFDKHLKGSAQANVEEVAKNYVEVEFNQR